MIDIGKVGKRLKKYVKVEAYITSSIHITEGQKGLFTV